ncbi:ribonuclease E inhibitor RraA/Dimethylmenaquinone methyltransferase [Hygrophoropsis aurantiaca]|uniref:Ribonuclease E inhibitor RraA/Dimethylmenaquinone methyltransferase n=1 Tax=Hygrophoropsis aurantiaca TaxID=72124 RepID=A0ACB8ATI5_9AGAM|nr:ribonuclease E inhibitor RraA/Dimethylmenaquinone methyltransferase [Hygrophoropsis aurantiaca]
MRRALAFSRLQAISRAMSMRSNSPLSPFSSCEISDALIKLGSPNGGHIPDIHMLSPTSTESQLRICAPAYTVQMVLASDKAAPKLSAHFVDTATPGSIIVIDAPPQTKNAVWGGLMTAGAQARDVVGVVISGRCRDLAEHRGAGFPVFARGHSTVGQSPFVRPSEVNVPLLISAQGAGDAPDAFAPVKVEPGDWIIADEDGVVCVPKDIVDQVVELAKKGQEIDAKCMEDIRAGKGVQASFKKYRGS